MWCDHTFISLSTDQAAVWGRAASIKMKCETVCVCHPPPSVVTDETLRPWK